MRFFIRYVAVLFFSEIVLGERSRSSSRIEEYIVRKKKSVAPSIIARVDVLNTLRTVSHDKNPQNSGELQAAAFSNTKNDTKLIARDKHASFAIFDVPKR